MDEVFLFTGGTGFIGRRLIRRLLLQRPATQIISLVEPRFLAVAQAHRAQLETEIGGSYEVVAGDITLPGLGVEPSVYLDLLQRVSHVVHLAALYDLAVSQTIAWRVNVVGTEHVLRFLRDAAFRPAFLYFSTCYVSGKRRGEVGEADLNEQFGFKNHYESTKFEAEKRVRAAVAEGLRAVILRPGIVCGDSQTGETEKFDGLYFVLALVDKLKWFPGGIPRPGSLGVPVNLVPVDYVEAVALECLAQWDKAAGKTFQIADPDPLTARQCLELVCHQMVGRPPGVWSPAWAMDALLALPAFRRWVGVPREMMVYFNHPVRYDSSQLTALLAPTQIRCPRLPEYFPKLYGFWKSRR